jgi:hypothetical protein
MGSLESRLALIWTEALEVEGVGVDDTFIDLGGESIAAALCANRLRRDLGVVIRPATLLAPGMTVKRLAAVIEHEGGDHQRLDA